MPYLGNDVFRPDYIPAWRGVRITDIEDIAFESAKIGGIFQTLEIDKVKQISSIYKRLEKYNEFGSGLTEKIMKIGSDTKVVDIIGILELMSNDYLNLEKNLKIKVDKAIMVLE